MGTNGTLKAIDNLLAQEMELQLMFCNTYHLMLQPGTALIKQAGGIHKFIGRSLPIITDSGGFQVFSLAYGGVAKELKSQGKKHFANSVVNITEEGVTFRSYRDGHKLLLSPERSIAAQKELGANIMISFDELPPYHVSPEILKTSFERTHRWAERSLTYHKAHPTNQALYAVIHGGIDATLRKISCQQLTRLNFDGFAIGGSFGKNKKEMMEMLDITMPHLTLKKPVHLLGMADAMTLKNCIPLGIDTFDAAHPTKAARHGLLFTAAGGLRILNKMHATNFNPIVPDCPCYTCKNFTVAYLRHLFKAHELTAFSLATIHNLHFMLQLMADYRKKIEDGVL
ncbi:MAG: queuine tRNA-ribosyltransferase [Bacillota bacterium]